MALSIGNPKVLKARLAFLEKEAVRQPLLFARIADYYIELGKHKKAQKILAKGLSQHPDYSSGWVVRGNLCLSLEQRHEALDAFKRALKIDPANQYAQARCSDLALEVTNYDEYYYHIISLSLLDMMNGKVRSMEHNEILCRLAVKAGFYTLKEAHRQHPEQLMRILRDNNLLPPELREDPGLESVELPDFPDNYPDEGFLDSVCVSRKEPRPVKAPAAAVEYALPEEHPAVEKELEIITPELEQPSAALDAEARLRSVVESLSREFRPSQTPQAAPTPVEAATEPPLEEIEAPEEPAPPVEEFRQSVKTEAGMFEIYQEVPAPPVSPPPTRQSEPPPVVYTEPTRAPLPPSTPESGAAEIIAETEPPRAFRIEPFSAEEPESEEPVEMPEEELPNIKVKLRDEKYAEFPVGQDRGSKLQSLQQKTDDETRKLLAQIAKEVTESDVSTESETDEVEDSSKRKSKRIITRTRAELYASQGDYDQAVEMYEDLIMLHPDNQSYRNRLEEIKEKMEAQKTKDDERRQREDRL